MSQLRRQIPDLALRLVLSCAGLLLCASVGAVPAGEILIGYSAELSGEASAKDNKAGAQAYFDWINARGGVNGSKIRLLAMDDKRDPKLAVENTKVLIDEKKVVALFGYRSTPTVQAVIPLIQERKMPLVAPVTGAQALHGPQSDYVFNLRASYADEAYKIVQQIATMGISKVALFYQDDTFGRELLAGFERGIRERQLSLVASAGYQRQNLNTDDAVARFVEAAPQAVLMACSPRACAQLVKEIRGKGLHPQFVTVSNVNTQEFFAALAAQCRGVAISQVVPHPNNIGVPVVQEFHRVSKSTESPPPPNYAAMEGFIGAKLVVEGLKRAGDNPTPARLTAVLDSFKELDLGGLTVSYTRQDRVGSRFVELTVLSQDCSVRR